MKKILCLGLLVLAFSHCEPEERCTTCATIVKYPNTDVQLFETYACGDVIKKLDGRFSCAVNPMTGELMFYIISVCNVEH